MRDAVRLLQLFEVTRQRRPLVYVNVVGGGYDFVKVKPLFNSLAAELSQATMTTLRTELQSSGQIVGQLSSSLINGIPNAISVFFNPAAGDAMADAAIKDVIAKIGRKAELLNSKAIGTSTNLVARPKRRSWRKPGAAAVMVGEGVAMGVNAGVGEGAGREEASGEEASASAPSDAV